MKALDQQHDQPEMPVGVGRRPRRHRSLGTIGGRAVFPDQFLPAPPAGVRLADLNLRVRTIGAFEREGYIDRPARISSVRVAEALRSWNNFAWVSLVDYLTAVERYRQDPKAFRPQFLEEEIQRRLAPRGPDRVRRLIRAYYQFDGAPEKNRTAIGREFGFKSERTRQICAPTNMRRTAPPMPILDQLLDLAAAGVPKSGDDMLARLRKTGLVGGGFRLETLAKAAHAFGRKTPPALREMVAAAAALRRTWARLPRQVLKVARSLAKIAGAVHVPDLLAHFSAFLGTKPMPAESWRHLKADECYRPLDSSGAWFTFAGCSGNSLARRIRQVFSVCPVLSAGQLRAGLSRARWAKKNIPPPNVLARFCRQVLACKIVGGQITANMPEDPVVMLGRVDAAIVRILREQGPVCGFRTVTAAVSRLGLSRHTASACLYYSPFIVKVGHDAYSLIGTATPNTRAAAQRVRHQIKAAIPPERSPDDVETVESTIFGRLDLGSPRQSVGDQFGSRRTGEGSVGTLAFLYPVGYDERKCSWVRRFMP